MKSIENNNFKSNKKIWNFRKGYLFILDEVNRYLKPKEDIRGGKITGQLTYI